MNSLRERRRKYIFRDPQRFSEVARDEVKGVNFLLSEVDPIIKRIRNFPRLNALGIDLGGGAIFYGPKGTGKTYFAQYLATSTKECARFVNMRGFPRPEARGRDSSLAAEDIRELFRLSQDYVKKHNRPIILCYDEFEEIEEETLEELRIQLSGLERRFNGIYLLFISTNAPEDLDERLFRPGRISDIVRFTELTVAGQNEVLRFAVLRHSHAPDIDFESIVHLSDEVNTPAAIVDIANSAYRSAVEEEDPSAKIEQRHVVLQYLRCITGQAVEETLDEKELWIAALHEAGHTVLAQLLGIKVRFTSILPQFRNHDRHGQTSVEPPSKIIGMGIFLDFLAFRFGGLVCEKLFGYHDLLTLEDDIRDINSTVNALVEKLGHGHKIQKRYGHISFDRSLDEYSDELRQMAECDKGRLIKRALRRAWRTVRKAGEDKIRTKAEKIARALIEKKILIRNEIEELLDA